MEVEPGYKRTETGVIPEDWEIKKLADLVRYTNGVAHEQSITDSGRFVVVNSRFISTEGLVRKYSDHCLCPAAKGDVLMVMSDVPNGKAIAKCYWVESDNTYTVNQRICLLNPVSINGKFLLYKLDRNPFYLAFDDGAKQTNLRKDVVLSCPLAIPKSNIEQSAIAGALSDVDRLLNTLQRQITKKHDLKQATMQQLLTGGIRLPRFQNDWEIKSIGDLLIYERPDEFFVQNVEYEDSADTPVLTANKSFILGYTNENFGIYRDLPAIIFDDFTTDCKYVDFPFKVKSSAIKILKPHSPDTNLRFVYERMRLVNFPLGEHKRYYISLYRHVTFPMPQPAEQNAIAEVVSDMDAELAALERRRDKISALKQGMMQELLAGKTRLL
jgi:type I restriction enzyme S subunit